MSAARLNIVLGAVAAVLFALSFLTARGIAGFDPAWWSKLAAEPDLARIIFFEIRLPRAVLALLTGAALGMAGAAFQGLLRNPLADPGVIGTSGGAALGAVIAFYSGASAAFALALPLGGLAGAAGALALLFLIAGRHASVLTLVLAGVAIQAAAGALTALALNLAPSPFAAYEIMFWMLGSVSDRPMTIVLTVAPFIMLGLALMLGLRRGLDALTLGEDTARSLGIDVRRLQMIAAFGATLAVGASVSATGVIGFAGLAAPHLVRPFVGQSPGATLLPAALAGAALILAADILVRLIPFGPELKLGVVTALAGAPFFLWLILRTRREGA